MGIYENRSDEAIKVRTNRSLNPNEQSVWVQVGAGDTVELDDLTARGYKHLVRVAEAKSGKVAEKKVETKALKKTKDEPADETVDGE